MKSLLGRLKYRSDLNRSSARAIIKEFSNWYTEDNPVLQNFAVDKDSSSSKGLYSAQIRELIDMFFVEDAELDNSNEMVGTDDVFEEQQENRTRKKEKPLDVDELKAIDTILSHMNFVFESYGKIWRNGRWVIKRLSQIAIALNNYSFSTERVTFSPLMSQAFAFAPSCP